MDTNKTESAVVKEEVAKKETKAPSKKKASTPKPKAAPASKSTPAKPAPAKKIKDSDMVDVRSCCVGRLSWKSPKTGYKIIWDEFGTVNPMSVEDLRDMRNGSRSFFERNWVAVEGDNAEEVLKFLQIDKYYQDFTTVDDIDEIFSYEPDEIIGVVSKFTPGLKELVARRAAILKDEGEIDSVKIIEAIQKSTGYTIE